MNILILVPEIKSCGPINVVLSLISSNYFKKSEINVFLVEIRLSEESPIKKVFREILGSNFISLGGVNVKSFRDLKKILVDLNIEVVHSHGFYPDVFSAFLPKNNVFKISTCHSILHEDYYALFGYKAKFYSYIHYYLYRKNINTVVGCSETVARNLFKNNVFNSICIHNGININRFSILPIEEKQERIVGLGEQFVGKKIFIYAGSLWHIKRVPDLINYFINHFSDDSNVLIILGEGPDFEACIQEIGLQKNIFMFGKVTNPEYYLQLSDISLSYSSSEGFPLAVLEALACGCLVYLSDIAPHKEIIDLYPNQARLINNVDSQEKFQPLTSQDLRMISDDSMAKKYIDQYLKGSN